VREFVCGPMCLRNCGCAKLCTCSWGQKNVRNVLALHLHFPHTNLFLFSCSEEDEIGLQNAMSDPSLSCEQKTAWIGVTDYQGEGNFLNVSRNTYEDVFVYEKDVGVNLTETKWREFEPSGGVIENCVSSTFNRPVLLLGYIFLFSVTMCHLFDDF
jgi:hypothetical protein